MKNQKPIPGLISLLQRAGTLLLIRVNMEKIAPKGVACADCAIELKR